MNSPDAVLFDSQSDKDRYLLAILSKKPRVLILGQHYLGPDRASNPLLAAFSSLDGRGEPYPWWLTSEDSPAKRATQLSKLEKSVLVPESVQGMLRLAWSAVFTSAIDGLLRQKLEIPGRRVVHQVMAVTSTGQSNSGALHLHRLFGTIEREAVAELPPQDRNDLLRRRQSSLKMLDPLFEFTTPEGVVLIEGWNPLSGDWLRTRDLVPALLRFGRGQVVIFGVDELLREHLLADEDLHALLDSGSVLLLEESLVESLASLRGRHPQELPEHGSDQGSAIVYRVLSTGRPARQDSQLDVAEMTEISFTALDWYKLTGEGLHIPVPLNQSQTLPESKEELYALFRSFIGRELPPASWPLLDQLAFPRPQLQGLVNKCLDICATVSPQDHLIIVHGQSGSGKTVLISQLALALRRRGLPVLYFGTHILPLNQSHVDAFCEAISEHSRAPVFLVYDAMSEEKDYFSLASYLASRGRKCVIVGTCYSFDIKKRRSHSRPRRRAGVSHIHPFEVGVKLSPSDYQRLLDHIAQYAPDVRERIPSLPSMDLSNFFVLIYRTLPESRLGLASGLISELRRGADKLQQKLRELSQDPALQKPQGPTLMAQQLHAAIGATLSAQTEAALADDPELIGDENRKAAFTLIHAVMVSSCVHAPDVPQSLALRLIQYNLAAYRGAVQIDIFTVKEAGGGEFILGARHPLEAEIWTQHYLKSRADQFDLIRRLVLRLQGSELTDTHRPELEYVVKLLQAIGPHAEAKYRYSAHFKDIADLIRSLRENSLLVHPRLLLIESHSRREWVQAEQNRYHRERRAIDADAQAQWLDSLSQAQEVLMLASQQVRAQSEGALINLAQRRILATLATERACVFGVQIGTMLRTRDKSPLSAKQLGDADRWLLEAKGAWREALRYDEQNMPALDSASWILSERYKLGGIEPVQLVELVEDWADVIERYNELPLSGQQQDKLFGREAEMYQALQDTARFQQVLIRAEKAGSSAVHVLQARLIESPQDRTSDEAKLFERKRKARAYLEAHCGETLRSDRNLLALYFRLWWETETELEGYFPHERLRLKFDQHQWQTLSDLARARIQMEGDLASVLFLRACALVHLGSSAEAEGVFRLLDQMEVGGALRSRGLLLITNERGTPRRFTAEFQGKRRGNTPLAWCDELRLNIPFDPREQSVPDLRPGTLIGPFPITLRFRGLYAENPQRSPA